MSNHFQAGVVSMLYRIVELCEAMGCPASRLGTESVGDDVYDLPKLRMVLSVSCKALLRTLATAVGASRSTPLVQCNPCPVHPFLHSLHPLPS